MRFLPKIVLHEYFCLLTSGRKEQKSGSRVQDGTEQENPIPDDKRENGQGNDAPRFSRELTKFTRLKTFWSKPRKEKWIPRILRDEEDEAHCIKYTRITLQVTEKHATLCRTQFGSTFHWRYELRIPLTWQRNIKLWEEIRRKIKMRFDRDLSNEPITAANESVMA